MLVIGISRKANRNKFIPTVTGGHVYNDKQKILIFLLTKCGWLITLIIHETVNIEVYSRNLKITSEKAYQNFKTKIKKSKEESHQKVIEKVLTETNDKKNRLIDL